MLGGLWKTFNNARAIVLAVIVHVVALGILVVNMEWLDFKPASTTRSAPIQTQTVDQKLIEKELARVEEEKKRKEAERKKEQQRIEKEKQRLAELERKRKAEEKRLKELAEKKKLEAKRKKELAAKKKRETEAKKKAEAERQRKVAAEKKRKAEAEKKRKKAEAEKKRKAEEQRRQAAAAEQRRQKEREQALLMQIEAEENASKIAQIRAMIQADVQNNYYIPPTARKGMQCTMLIRLFPSGEVQSVTITRSSGDRVFDKAAEDAVYRASPLPVSVSSAGKLFNEFREFNFIFKPVI